MRRGRQGKRRKDPKNQEAPATLQDPTPPPTEAQLRAELGRITSTLNDALRTAQQGHFVRAYELIMRAQGFRDDIKELLRPSERDVSGWQLRSVLALIQALDKNYGNAGREVVDVLQLVDNYWPDTSPRPESVKGAVGGCHQALQLIPPDKLGREGANVAELIAAAQTFMENGAFTDALASVNTARSTLNDSPVLRHHRPLGQRLDAMRRAIGIRLTEQRRRESDVLQEKPPSSS